MEQLRIAGRTVVMMLRRATVLGQRTAVLAQRTAVQSLPVAAAVRCTFAALFSRAAAGLEQCFMCR